MTTLSSNPRPTLYLVVARGPDVGARLLLAEAPKQIGRNPTCDLVLTDGGVSRLHLEVLLRDGSPSEVVLRCVGDAAGFLVGGEPKTEHVLVAGDKVVLANTMLVVEAATPHAVSMTEVEVNASRPAIEVTETKRLLQGLAADVRSLRLVTDLIDVLDHAHDHAAIELALSAWASKNAGAKSATLRLGADVLRATPPLERLADAAVVEMIVTANPDKDLVDVAVAAHAHVPAAAVFVGLARDLDDETRRLLAVAARIVASALARVALEQAMSEDIESLRTLAIGSARAFLGVSPAALEVGRLVGRLAAVDVTALILGESGTGKSFVARLIHEASSRVKEPFRVLNCAAIPETLLESELFGHERGAFSGAVTAHAGAFEAAGRGTILLDEIGELTLAAQAKLLRVLEERRFERVGSNRTLTLEARVIAATNRDLSDMVAKGTFRQDLFFRVSVVTVRVPALRERGDDVVILAKQMLADLSRSAGGRRVTGFSTAGLDALRAYTWPGNVRELRNAIEHALVLGDGPTIEPKDLPESLRLALAPRTPGAGAGQPAAGAVDEVKLPAKLEWLEERAIEAALKATGGNRTKAAALLGINRATLYKKLREEEE